jgi:hypothetical protein
VHACFPEGDVIIEIFTDNHVVVSSAHKNTIDRGVKKPLVKRALKIAAAEVDALLELWEDSRIK